MAESREKRGVKLVYSWQHHVPDHLGSDMEQNPFKCSISGQEQEHIRKTIFCQGVTRYFSMLTIYGFELAGLERVGPVVSWSSFRAGGCIEDVLSSPLLRGMRMAEAYQL